MSRNEDAPAFPIVHPDGSGVQYFGMSLRDYFAAKAIQGMLCNDALVARHKDVGERNLISADSLMATSAYAIADAMLAERAK